MEGGSKLSCHSQEIQIVHIGRFELAYCAPIILATFSKMKNFQKIIKIPVLLELHSLLKGEIPMF